MVESSLPIRGHGIQRVEDRQRQFHAFRRALPQQFANLPPLVVRQGGGVGRWLGCIGLLWHRWS